jgi:hypothetical protein
MLPEEKDDSAAASTLTDKFWETFDLFEGQKGVALSLVVGLIGDW